MEWRLLVPTQLVLRLKVAILVQHELHERVAISLATPEQKVTTTHYSFSRRGRIVEYCIMIRSLVVSIQSIVADHRVRRVLDLLRADA